jgi:imidazoleglycerol-phosphate dehydratase / histidinol-phosphatase
MEQKIKIKKKVLFIDRDGTLIKEPPTDFQVDKFEKLQFVSRVFSGLGKIARELDFELVMVTNQDGLGTESYPFENFIGPQKLMLEALESEGIVFSDICIDKSFPHENKETRKPKTALLTKYFSEDYDLSNSYVIGDRMTDVELAKNLGSKAIYFTNPADLGLSEISTSQDELNSFIALKVSDWEEIYTFLRLGERTACIERKTHETNIKIDMDLDGHGESKISTGLAFFDHMLHQIAKHGQMNLNIHVEGDLEVDEHHTIEDTAIALGECFASALGSKLGIERYGFSLPMDDCFSQVAIDFGGRNWLVWETEFKREKIGDLPTEMFFHFFKSFTDGARCNLYVKAKGTNEHHKIESIFKAFAKAIKMAKKRDGNFAILPTTKGII